MKRKHLTFEERIIIEELLNKGEPIHKIALKLNRPDSSVVREIKRNRYISAGTPHKACNKLYNEPYCRKKFEPTECIYQMETGKKCREYVCRGCNIMCDSEHCPDFVDYICKALCTSPYVCNGCKNASHCRENFSIKFRYQAKRAQVIYEDKLKETRSGISLTPEEMEKLDNIVSPLLFKGHSIRAIYMEHKDELPCSESTLYGYVDRCYLTARNIDMPRKVRFKQRYYHGPRAKSFQEFVAGRTYADFKKYNEENPDLNIWEMDTVIGTITDDKCLLTLLYRKSTFMIAILLDNHTQEAVINALNGLSDAVGIAAFQKYFQVILTDRGVEFGNPYAIEADQYGEIKTKLFYCDPYCSWQKGMVEKNHEFIRMVLPKGKSLEGLSQKEIHLMMNHINNYPRKSLNGATPYELSKLLLGRDFLAALHYHRISPDDVILKPFLLRDSSKNS